MSNAVIDSLQGQEENYIMPFLWLHGEEESVLREYMKAIRDANIRAVCVESRPHPDFLGPKWWKDMDVIIEEAKKRGMKVWILDDQHYPTGKAAGALKKAPVELHKQYLDCNMTDVYGPMRRVRLDLNKLGRTPRNFVHPTPPEYDDDRILAIVAARLDGEAGRSQNHVDQVIRLNTGADPFPPQDGFLIWDVPEGEWRVFCFYVTHNGANSDAINLVDSASCKVLLDTVYEAHYRRYGEEFGKTIAGFFSDEPSLGNIEGNVQGAIVGQYRMPLPWSVEMESEMKGLWGAKFAENLPALWGELGSKEETAKIRVSFMNVLTGLVQKNFSEQIGDWCRAHGVEYIGHIIEDNNASEGLGVSVGHFFRGLMGQDMAGIDDIGSQITVGGANVEHVSVVGSGDGAFYHHVLGKLGSSLAHVDPKKKDRCMCECFGAYGWTEGTQTMKYIADHLLADGVNHFVPHAFSAKAFPDFDCPPHFYAGGEDLLYPAFGKLMAYMNRTAHVLSAYRHTAPVAVLYHAESAWSGMRWEKLQTCARELREHQIDFDILPSEALALRDGELTVNGRSYQALVIPGCEYLPQAAVAFCDEALESGFPVYFADFAPETDCQIVKLSSLSGCLEAFADIRLSPAHSDIRIYHGHGEEEDVFFLFNESPWKPFDGCVEVTAEEDYCYRYDAMENRLYACNRESVDDRPGSRILLRLEPMESALFLFTREKIASSEPESGVVRAFPTKKGEERSIPLSGKWRISLLEEGSFVPYDETDTLEGIMKDGWSGTIRYEYTVSEGEIEAGASRILLKLPQVREVCEVFCNGSPAGFAIAAPFVFDLTESWKAGENHLCIDVTTTMEQKVKAASGGLDWFISVQKVWYGYGLVGTPALEYLL
ncbi:MAG: hypothetical protein LUE87_11610 [Lachnospiraceae bacterium]|nr:hypothetical protein [Lachnospiraceae bacterium]